MAVYLPIISQFKDDGIKKANKSFKDLEGTGAKVAFAFKKALVPALAVLGALAGVTKGLIAAGEKASTSNARIRQIATSMNLFGKEADKVTDRLVDLANKTARQTGLDQNAIKETQAKLLTFKNLAKTADDVGGAFDRATKAAIDLAAAGFGEATSNAAQLGKALEDPIKGLTALTRSGVTFTEEQKELIKTLVESGRILEAQELILGAIETQVGGTAEATANASDKMKVAFDQLKEKLGEQLLPVFEKAVDILIKFADWAKNNDKAVLIMAAALGALAASIVAVNIAMALNPFVLIAVAIAALVTAIVIYWPQIKAFLRAFGEELDRLLGPIDEILGFIAKMGVDAFKTLKGTFSPGKLPIPQMADGGIVKARPGGTLAIIGEGGRDEAVVPLRNGMSALSGGSPNVIINVSGALDPVAVARQIDQLLKNNTSNFGF
jgi:hypothetical protein